MKTFNGSRVEHGNHGGGALVQGWGSTQNTLIS